MTYPQYPQQARLRRPTAASPAERTAITAAALAAIGGLLGLGLTATSLFFPIAIATVGSQLKPSDLEFLGGTDAPGGAS